MSGLLDPTSVRRLAAELGVKPSKQRGQNFVIDANTVRKIVAAAAIEPGQVVLEVGPGLGSLTLGLLEAGADVTAVEIESAFAARLSQTVHERMPEASDRLRVVEHDALTITELPGPPPAAIVANLPYNVAVPVLLHLWERFDSLRGGLVMVQAEVADRLVAAPGSRVYGVPSAKLAWFATAERAGAIGRKVFWPEPNVDSGLVSMRACPPPETGASRTQVFAVIDAAFSQRRKMLRSALSAMCGGSAAASAACEAAGVDPTSRGETLAIADFARIALHVPDPREGSLS